MGPPISAAWAFRASSSLGGDALGYHWLDDEHSRSTSSTCAGTAWARRCCRCRCSTCSTRRPCRGSISAIPRRCWPASTRRSRWTQHGMFFTIWYGVFHAHERLLEYAVAAHPAAILLPPGRSRARWASRTCPSAPRRGRSSASRRPTCRRVPARDHQRRHLRDRLSRTGARTPTRSSWTSSRRLPARLPASNRCHHRCRAGPRGQARVRRRLHPVWSWSSSDRPSGHPVDSAPVDAFAATRRTGSVRTVATGVTPSRR